MTSGKLAGTRVLVTGGSGRIGIETVRRLKASGASVAALSNRPNAELVADRVIVGDARSESTVSDALREVDLVVHLAALAHRDIAPGFQVYSTNVVSTYNVLAQAAERGVKRTVVAGSINRYGLPQGNREDATPAYFPIDTDMPADVSDWYSLSKYNDENTSRMVNRRWGMDVITLRFPHTNTADALRTASDQLSMDPRRGLTEGWSYLDVRDAARAIELGLLANTHGAYAFYLAADRTSVPYQTDQLLDRYASGVPRLVEFVGRQVPIDLTPARELIGFQARHELDLEVRELP
ncbi:UDP-glucose 4-epimerase [Microlunatus endophyticus]|uniref:UDP-glucose 4-epimerase n=1 Tax=Microlunatus endophyticus TaxID=1716077 RepID=A0A917W967_9ACTN|nr:NAD(P)-dependent oxidoreductase [Microlunatus endophyticus]GGL79817.1 UDP-glucose 4-epimerase [Microlunatus endophyticus]